MVIWNTKSQTKTLFSSYAVIALLILGAIGITVAAFDRASSLERRKVQIRGLNEDLARLDGILADRLRYRGVIERIGNTLPADYEETAKFISQLETRAKETSVTVADTQLDTAKEGTAAKATVLKVTQKLTGTYQSISAYVTSVARLPFHTSVAAMEISGEGGGVSATVVIKVALKTL